MDGECARAIARRWRGRRVRVHRTHADVVEGVMQGPTFSTRPIIVGLFGSEHIAIGTSPQSSMMVASRNIARIELAR